jgi:hypothetical protein
MSGKTTLPNFKALLGTAKLPERTVLICLRGDLVAEHEELERQLADLNRRPSDSLAGNGATEVAERIEALQEQMAASTVTFRLRAMPKPKWRALLAEHPPRRDDDGNPNPEDAQIGVNLETFWDAIARACIVEPEIDDETWEILAGPEGKLTDNQVGRLADAAWSVNRGDVDVPFSRAASQARRTIGTASSSPND